MDELVLSPSDFVAVFNQTLEYAYPQVVIEGELANFRVAKNRWVYFDIKDEAASVPYFGTVYMLPGPLEDGLRVRAVGAPRLHPRFGFTINLFSLVPVGEGSLKKAADLLAKKLAAEGLFAPERKRPLPELPEAIGLITAEASAACADFCKILDERWGGVEVQLADVLVQGEGAPTQIVIAIEHFNQQAAVADVLVITRGGGSADDLAAFNDERVVRAVAASRIPTLIAIGHEVDFSLAELAADQRASTPSNAAQVVVPDRRHVLTQLESAKSNLRKSLLESIRITQNNLRREGKYLTSQVFSLIEHNKHSLTSNRKLVGLFDPKAALRRGYAIISRGTQHISSVKQLRAKDKISIELRDGTIGARVEGSS